MPRKPRLFVDGGVYHVYRKTHRGEMRFGMQIDTDSFIDSIAAWLGDASHLSLRPTPDTAAPTPPAP